MLLNNVDRVPSNVQFSPQEALLYVCEDNEAVFKMNITGRSPAMRRVSRTQRVALDCFFDWINLVPIFKSNTLDKVDQLADMLTKGFSHVMNVKHLLCFVWRWPFQFYSFFWSDVEKKTKKNRHSELKTNDESFSRVLSNLSPSASESPEKRSY